MYTVFCQVRVYLNSLSGAEPTLQAAKNRTYAGDSGLDPPHLRYKCMGGFKPGIPGLTQGL
jgi:hypothetical protein